ncbi:MAG: hypothetical protein A2822_00805 [Candidatus Staskawiczbacteria bacterium RIFCSPHIGHO2_01_FULL_41_41]|uniref:Uncharacterized protein n=1 Tax=Candidatus Staskawiczbacteria bacterium RIFCSPHIGHO2_01_FULL_41_41 TaxID=1802203 RepID=A0A1G2HRI3_9BACT|nr:MAG: hypothetical protein A2822_00805 [Candidatus Staskawiczbacteria bacterium RIFCSPHIGHO2_01_FULL_41_41]HLD79657.1 hypothetical protein [Candidatus Nanoarchaeia archaeon]
MTIELVLPGYKVEFPNQVYSRSYTGDNTATHKDGSAVKLTDVLILGRYTQPSEGDVVEFLQKKAREVGGSPVLVGPRGERLSSGKSIVEEAIEGLPSQVQADLRSGDQGLYGFIKKHTPAYPLKEGEAQAQYLTFDYGILPTEVIETNQNAGKIESATWYRGAFVHDQLRAAGLGLQWQIKLLYAGGLPSKEEMDVLLKHGTTDSTTFTISRKPYDVDEVRTILGTIHATLDNTDNFAELRDGSTEALQAVGLVPIMKLHETLERQMRAQQEAQATLKGARQAVPSGLIKP